MEYWSDLEIDFIDQYGVLDPLSLSWRKLIVLVRGLKYESLFITQVRESSPEYRREMMHKAIHGDDYDPREKVSRSRVTAEQMLAGI